MVQSLCQGGESKHLIFPEADQQSTRGWLRIIMPARNVANTHFLYYRWSGNSTNQFMRKHLQEPDNRNY